MSKTVQDFVEQMKSGNYCNGDAHMAVYITKGGKVIDGLKRMEAASITDHPVLIKVVNNSTTKEDVETLLHHLPKSCSCGQREC